MCVCVDQARAWTYISWLCFSWLGRACNTLGVYLACGKSSPRCSLPFSHLLLICSDLVSFISFSSCFCSDLCLILFSVLLSLLIVLLCLIHLGLVFFHLLLLLSLLHSLRFFGLSVIVVSSVTVRARGTSVFRRCNWFRELVCRLIGICYSLLLLVCGFVVADALNRRLCSWYLLLSLLPFFVLSRFRFRSLLRSLTVSLPIPIFSIPRSFSPSLYLPFPPSFFSLPLSLYLPPSFPFVTLHSVLPPRLPLSSRGHSRVGVTQLWCFASC